MRNKKYLPLLLSVTFFVAALFPLTGQEIDEDSLFGGNSPTAEGSGGAGATATANDAGDDSFADAIGEDALFGGDDLFGDDSVTMVEDIPTEEEDSSPAYLEFLTTDEVQIGGTLRSTLSAFWSWPDIPATSEEIGEKLQELLSVDLSASVYLNARPTSSLRIFMKAKTSYPFTSATRVQVPAPASAPALPAEVVPSTSINTLNLTIFELYSDINFDQQLFFRFGKQTINWGVGYFWSPADFISLTPIDVEEPEAEREGPVALKVSLPLGFQEIDAYVIASDKVRKLEDLELALRGNFYFDFGDSGLETQLGLGYQKDRPFRIITSFRLPLRNLDFFLEGRLSFGREGKKINEDETLVDDTAPYFSATGGFNLRLTDLFESIIDLGIIGQYYFNHEGYENAELLPVAITKLQTGEVHPSTVANFGMHYTALSLSISQFFLENLSISSLWLANWSDVSGQIRTTVSYRFFENFSLSLAVINAYGGDPSEYGKIDGRATVKNPFGALAFSTTLSIGGGRF